LATLTVWLVHLFANNVNLTSTAPFASLPSHLKLAYASAIPSTMRFSSTEHVESAVLCLLAVRSATQPLVLLVVLAMSTMVDYVLYVLLAV